MRVRSAHRAGPSVPPPIRHSLGAGAAALLTMMLRCVGLHYQRSAALPCMPCHSARWHGRLRRHAVDSDPQSRFNTFPGVHLCREVGGPFAEARCVAVACPSCMTLELAQSCDAYVVSGHILLCFSGEHCQQ